MPPVPKGSVRITKQITNTDKQKYANAEFSFKAYIQDAVDSEHYTVIPEGTHFQIWEIIRMKVVLLKRVESLN